MSQNYTLETDDVPELHSRDRRSQNYTLDRGCRWITQDRAAITCSQELHSYMIICDQRLGWYSSSETVGFREVQRRYHPSRFLLFFFSYLIQRTSKIKKKKRKGTTTSLIKRCSLFQLPDQSWTHLGHSGRNQARSYCGIWCSGIN